MALKKWKKKLLPKSLDEKIHKLEDKKPGKIQGLSGFFIFKLGRQFLLYKGCRGPCLEVFGPGRGCWMTC